MGIQGLRKEVTESLVTRKLSDLKHTRVAIDGYALLHRGAYKDAKTLCEGKDSQFLSEYIMKVAQCLQSCQITPIFVFDGAELPSKKMTEDERKKSRDCALEKAKQLEDSGLVNDSEKYYNKAVEIKPWMATAAIKSLREIGVESIVAPYEADSELGYLSKIGYVDAVLCEDSDLIVHGCKRVWFGFNLSEETVKEFTIENFAHTELGQLSREKLVYLCVFAGCDYCKSLRGVGIKKALKLVTSAVDIEKVLDKMVNETFKYQFNDNEEKRKYLENVRDAVFTFNYAYVYDPISENIVNTNEVPEDEEMNKRRLLGERIEDDIGKRVAEGELDPSTHECFDMMEESTFIDGSITSKTVGGSNGKFLYQEPSLVGYNVDPVKMIDCERIMTVVERSQNMKRSSMSYHENASEIDESDFEAMSVMSAKSAPPSYTKGKKRGKKEKKEVPLMKPLLFSKGKMCRKSDDKADQFDWGVDTSEFNKEFPECTTKKRSSSFLEDNFNLVVPDFDMYYFIKQLH
ncbi:exodeoxyribonuclease, putative [Entamoeba invadens IP1]|uniref:exodeoxyribonuclease, putative n=1 Tax=Entamoeba invadens IP1 TaxID=370355 RepID=UPI0002C3D00A|nr:exodeoxyribonuclease, putative [Entamoeba invadens IP1]ELP85438.1 exodeoxyribonuclease, putative [Entamoeba invadens IP1]|eukprot:XP_004184784.1 exodeoxyribonuclease, putative [Entamoeba invadens IP1]